MKTFPMLAIALGLLGGCKKDKKDEGDKPGTGTASGEVKKDPGPASGTGMASGTDTAAAPDSGAPVAQDPPPPEAGDGLTLKLTAPPVGTTATKNSTKLTDVVITAKGQQIPMHVEDVEIEHIKYVEVGEFPTKLEVSYEADHKTTTSQGKDKVETSPLEGKAYLVWKDGGKLTATHADATAVQPDELEKLAKSWDDEIGEIPGVATILTGHPWKVGEAFTLTPADLALLDKPGAKGTAGTITLQSQDGGNAVFLIDTKIDIDDGQTVGKLEAQVTATIQIDQVRPLSMITKGKIDATAGGMPFAGEMNGTETYTW